jgi:hypothetical protein
VQFGIGPVEFINETLVLMNDVRDIKVNVCGIMNLGRIQEKLFCTSATKHLYHDQDTQGPPLRIVMSHD